MRAIYILFILFIIILNGCATVEVAKEVTKATSSVKRTIQKIANNQDDAEKTENFITKKEEIVVARKIEEALISKQKEITEIIIQGKTLNQLTQDFGKPDLVREDGNTKAVRFNTSNCRLFIYFNLKVQKPKAEYYEIRNIKGELIDKKEKINKCFKEIQKT